MARRRRTDSGRTTPKGTTNPSRSTAKKPTRPASKPAREAPRREKVDKNAQWVSRPITHHRGNR